MHNCYNNCVYMHGYYSSSIYYFVNFFSLFFSFFLSLVSTSFSFFLLLLAPTFAVLIIGLTDSSLTILVTGLTNSGLTILVTGTVGFIKTHVSMALKRPGDGVLGLDNFNGSWIGLFADWGAWWWWLGVQIEWVSAWMGLFADQGGWWLHPSLSLTFTADGFPLFLVGFAIIACSRAGLITFYMFRIYLLTFEGYLNVNFQNYNGKTNNSFYSMSLWASRFYMFYILVCNYWEWRYSTQGHYFAKKFREAMGTTEPVDAKDSIENES